MEKTRYFNRMDEAFGILCLSISPELLFHVESCSTPNEVWKILGELFGKQDEMLRMINDSITIYRNRRERFSLEPEDPHVASLYAINYVQGLQETDGGDPNQLEGTIRDTVYVPGCENVACTGNEPKKDNVAAMAASIATGSTLQAAATLLQPTKLSVTCSSSRLSSSSSHVSRAFGFEAGTSAQVSSSLQDDVKEFAEKCAGATKRLIGRRFSDPPVQADMKLWPFKVVSGPDDKHMIEVDNMRDSSDQRPPRGRPPGTSIPMQQRNKQGMVKGISVLSAENTQTPSEQGKEKLFTKLSSFAYKGVVPQPNGRWGAQIYEKHQLVWLGTFNQEEVAARAYDRATIKFRGADAMTNLNLVESHQEAVFLCGHSKREIVDMLRKHTYDEELKRNKPSLDKNLDVADSTSTESSEPRAHLFDKTVSPSDVGKLNRFVIPKQFAAKYFSLEVDVDMASGEGKRKGVLLKFEDRAYKTWWFCYSSWNSVMIPLLAFLRDTKSYLMLNDHPFQGIVVMRIFRNLCVDAKARELISVAVSRIGAKVLGFVMNEDGNHQEAAIGLLAELFITKSDFDSMLQESF